MPPKQCPECGRFLKNAFVEALTDSGDPCPGCGQALTRSQFTHDGAAETSGSATISRAVDTSGAADDPDVLAGWDPHGVESSWQDDRPPPPTDLAAVAAGAAGGGLLGLIVTSRRIRGALIGAVLGAGVVAAVRRVWELDS